MQQIKAQNISGGGYEVGQSLLFNGGFLNRYSTSPSDGTKMTLSCWAKLGDLDGTQRTLFYSEIDSSNFEKIAINANGSLYWNNRTNGAVAFEVFSTRVLRDSSSWYHLCFVYDSNNNTPAQRAMMYVNGETVTSSTTTYPSQGLPSEFLSVAMLDIGKAPLDSNSPLDGYMAEVYGVQGQRLGPENFALTDAKGVYNPIPYTGAYGNNGFYLPFEASDIGADESGNGNDFTPNGLTSDSVVADSPSNNYSTFLPFPAWVSGSPVSSTFSNGNRTVFRPATAANRAEQIETISFTTGKFWRAFHIDKIPGATYDWMHLYVGEASSNHPSEFGINLDNRAGSIEYWDGAFPSENGYPQLAYGTGDIIGFAVDVDAGTVGLYKNGTFIFETNPAGWLPTTPNMAFGVQIYSYADSGQVTISSEGAPSGYLPLCTQNLPDPLVNPREHFGATAWTGDGAASRTIDTGIDAGLTWIKDRDDAYWHILNDNVRGGGLDKGISSNATDAEGGFQPLSYGGITSIDDGSFSVGKGNSGGPTESGGGNKSGQNYISWNFRGGVPVTNNDGNIPSHVSANKDMGFSVVKWTQNLQQLYTLGHALGKAPDLIIAKQLNSASWWPVYSKVTGPDSALFLNQADGVASSNTWGSFTPTSEIFMFSEVAGDYIAYCFTNTEMLQVGSYVGNGLADGPFIDLPFKPAFLMIKWIDGSQDWMMADTKVGGNNVIEDELRANKSDPVLPNNALDILSNGFKVRLLGSSVNQSNGSYLYLAISDQSFKHARGR